jgi:hypothetical protein
MAIEDRTGKPNTSINPAVSSAGMSPTGNGLRITASRIPAAMLASAARPKVMDHGLNISSAMCVAGKVPPNMTTPRTPSTRPSVSRPAFVDTVTSADCVIPER